MTTTFEVRKDNWAETRLIEEPLDESLGENEVLFKVDRTALTANNISYAATGDILGYWGFFPAEEGWGRIPAMGWGEVIASNHPDINVGERAWGWFPHSTHLKIVAGDVSATTIRDVSPHREPYAPVYAQFDRAIANPIYEDAREDQDSLLRGLFMTSWLVEDFLSVSDFFGASACLITSASSKTSIALAFCVRARVKLKSIGLTSPGNVEFCESLGCYDEVITYDDVSKLDADMPVVSVDMAGNADVLVAMHEHFGDNMKHSCRIGLTHHDKRGDLPDLPGARPEFFFAPSHVKTRSEEIGGRALMTQVGMAFVGFRRFCDDWLKVERSYGPDTINDVYQSVLNGKSDPASGQVLSLWPSDQE